MKLVESEETASVLETPDLHRKFLDVPYANCTADEVMDIYLPETGDGPFPVIVDIHGGGGGILTIYLECSRTFSHSDLRYQSGNPVFTGKCEEISSESQKNRSMGLIGRSSSGSSGRDDGKSRQSGGSQHGKSRGVVSRTMCGCSLSDYRYRKAGAPAQAIWRGSQRGVHE